MCWRCFCTVRVLIARLRAISRSVAPRHSRSVTCNSRGVSIDHGALCRCMALPSTCGLPSNPEPAPCPQIHGRVYAVVGIADGEPSWCHLLCRRSRLFTHRENNSVRLIRKISIGRLTALLSAFLLAGAMITGLAGTASAGTDGVQTLLFQIQSRYSSGKCLTNAPSGTVTL